jgi:hypothetical protein
LAAAALIIIWGFGWFGEKGLVACIMQPRGLFVIGLLAWNLLGRGVGQKKEEEEEEEEVSYILDYSTYVICC